MIIYITMNEVCGRLKKLTNLILVCLLWRGDVTNSYRDDYLKKISVCDFAYGSPLRQLDNARSFLSCTVECMKTEACTSLTHDPVTKVCKFNEDTLIRPKTSGCQGSSVFYTEKQTSVEFVTTTTPRSQSCCNEPVNNVRLCDGGGVGVCSFKQGRVEVLYNDTWGTVCDDFFGGDHYISNFGNVVCVTLGFTAGTTYFRAYFGEGSDPIWLDDVECVGNETSLFQCPHRGWASHNCWHYEDVGVMCF